MNISFFKPSLLRLYAGLLLCVACAAALTPRMPAVTASGRARTVYLTFDDGPSAVTAKVLDILLDEQVPATFFVIGAETEYGLGLYNRMVEEGHSLGLHTYTHDVARIYHSLEGYTRDFEALAAWVTETTGISPRICRMVGGSYTRNCPAVLREQILTYLVGQGYSCYDWDIDPRDSVGYAVPAWRIVQSVITDAAKNPNQDLIILLHDDGMRTTLPDALREIIAYFRGEGYRFDALREDTESAKRILPKNHVK